MQPRCDSEDLIISIKGKLRSCSFSFSSFCFIFLSPPQDSFPPISINFSQFFSQIPPLCFYSLQVVQAARANDDAVGKASHNPPAPIAAGLLHLYILIPFIFPLPFSFFCSSIYAALPLLSRLLRQGSLSRCSVSKERLGRYCRGFSSRTPQRVLLFFFIALSCSILVGAIALLGSRWQRNGFHWWETSRTHP